MGFRITNSILYRMTLGNVNRQRERLSVRQEQAASGLRVNRPSDDPAAVRTASVLRAALSANGQYERNVTQSRTRATRIESAIANTSDLLVRVRELALQGSNPLGTAEAGNLAGAVEQIHGSILAEANTTVNGSYVFGGYASDTPAFTVAGPFVEGTAPAPVTSFAGDSNEIVSQVDEGVTVTVTLAGVNLNLKPRTRRPSRTVTLALASESAFDTEGTSHSPVRSEGTQISHRLTPFYRSCAQNKNYAPPPTPVLFF